MKIRKATEKDLDVLSDLCYEEERLHQKYDKYARLRKDSKVKLHKFFKSNIGKNNYAAFIAEENDKIVGIITGDIRKPYFTYRMKSIGHYGTAFIKKDYRRKGILKLLISAMNKWFKSKNIKLADLYVHPKNRIALKAWKKLGFKEVLRLMRKEI